MSSPADDERDAFPFEAPDLWFVSAVPFLVEFVRQYLPKSKTPGADLARFTRDLEMGEISALEFVREVCLRSRGE